MSPWVVGYSMDDQSEGVQLCVAEGGGGGSHDEHR